MALAYTALSSGLLVYAIAFIVYQNCQNGILHAFGVQRERARGNLESLAVPLSFIPVTGTLSFILAFPLDSASIDHYQYSDIVRQLCFCSPAVLVTGATGC